MSKPYGLLIPEKSKAKNLVFKATHNVFGNDSDSEEDGKKKPVLLKPSANIKRQAKISQDKAILEDPTVFQYDEIYDELVIKKDKETKKDKDIKKPKYIEKLLKTAEKRKIENERRVERQVQKEREKEGDEFADKEVFVTSAYKKKLEDMRLEEEKEKREEYLESIGDVRKQCDLGGFYRHLYEQKLGSSNTKESNTENKGAETTRSDEKDKKKQVPSRNYRKRKSSENAKISDEEEEINKVSLKDIKDAKNATKENIDADSDFSIDESSDDDEDKPKVDKKEQLIKSPSTSSTVPIATVKEGTDEVPIDPVDKKETIPEVVEHPKVKIDIWKKRTVGEAFDQAVKRYYERKALRSY